MKTPNVVAAFEGMRGISFEQVKAKADGDARHRLTESDFKGLKGYERYHLDEDGNELPGEAEDGSYKWRWRPGRGDAVAEAMMGWAMQDVARIADREGYPGSYGIKGRRIVSLGQEPHAQEQGSSQGSAGRAVRRCK